LEDFLAKGIGLRVYGYTIMYRKSRSEPWIADQDDEYQNLPAHYPSEEEALDRAEFLRTKGVEARIAALLAEPTDDGDDFDSQRRSPND